MYAPIAVPVAALFVANIVKGSALPRALVSRQTISDSDIPAACQSTCDTIVTTLNTCTVYECFCTTGNDQALESCIDCILGVAGEANAALQAQAQEVLTNYASECAEASEPLPTLTASFTGVPSGASASAGGASASSAFDTATSPIIGFSSAQSRATTTSLRTSSTETSSEPSGTSAADSSSSTDDPLAQNGVMKVDFAGKSLMAVLAGLVGGVMMALV